MLLRRLLAGAQSAHCGGLRAQCRTRISYR